MQTQHIDFKHQLGHLIYSVVLTLMMQVIHIPSRQVYLVAPFGSNRVQTGDALCVGQYVSLSFWDE